MNHTPLPWLYLTDDFDTRILSGDTGGCTVALMGDRSLDPDCKVETNEADARLIVRAVNNHEVLLSMLDTAQSLADVVAGKYDMPDEAFNALAELAMNIRAVTHAARK